MHLRLAGRRCELPGERPQQGRLAGPVAADERDPLRPVDLQVAQRPLRVRQPEVTQGQDGLARVDLGVRELDADLVVVPDRVDGLVEPAPGLGEALGLQDAVLARRHLGIAPAAVGDDLRHPLVLVALLGEPLAPGQLDVGVREFALLPLDVGLGGPHHPLGRLLLHGQRLLVRREVAAVPGHLAVVQIRDLVDPVEEFTVVAHHDHHAGPGRDRVVEPPTGPQIQVVGRLVEQQDVGAAQQQRGKTQQHRLAAGELPDGPVETDCVQAELSERRPGPLLHVPVVADRREVLLAGVARLDGVQRGPYPVDAEGLVDPHTGGQGQVLRQIADLARRRDPAADRGEFTGEQAQQR